MPNDLTTLFIAHQHEIGGYLQRKVGDAADAADLYQDAFLRVAQLDRPEKIENPLGFIFTTVANLARDHMRRFIRRKKFAASEFDYEVAVSESTPEDAFLARERDDTLQKAIDSLPPKTRSVFLKYYVEGGSYREIGEQLGISPRTVEYHLRQALAYCRAEAQNAGLI